MSSTVSLFEKLNSRLIFPVRSDPTENDSVEGLRPNARGPGLVTFGVSFFFFFHFILVLMVYMSGFSAKKVSRFGPGSGN